MVNTAFFLGKQLTTHFDFAMNVGICGAFNKKFSLGELVNIKSDMISEIGAEDGEKFIPFPDLKLDGKNIFRLKNNLNLTRIKSAKGITVNTIHGNKKSIEKIISLLNPDVESMEGASFAMACESQEVKGIQIRAVSNYVEKRDKSKWNIPLAINNLNQFLIDAFSSHSKFNIYPDSYRDSKILK